MPGRQLLRRQPILLLFPGVSAVIVAVAAAAIWVPILLIDNDSANSHWRLVFTAATALTVLPVAFVTSFCNVGFLVMAQAFLHNEQPSVRDALRLGRVRLRPLALWSLLSALVGAPLRALERLPGGEWVARGFGTIGGAAWGTATYFVLPALIVDETNVKDAIARSASVVRRYGRRSVPGRSNYAFTTAIFVFLLTIVLLIGMLALALDSISTGIVLVSLGAGLSTGLLALSSAVHDLHRLLLYHQLVEHPAA